MKRTTMHRSTSTASGAVLLALALAACGGGEDASTASADRTSTSSGATSSTATEHNEADVDFARSMIMHHRQAIEMSDLLLAKDGVDERVTALAERIKAAQQPEIEQMSGWLEEWGEDVPEHGMSSMEMDSMGSDMGGMMSEEDMAALEAAEGPDAGRLFLEQMTEHHRGAVDMAQTEVEEGQDPEAVSLAETIVADQQAEIEEMQQLLAQL